MTREDEILAGGLFPQRIQISALLNEVSRQWNKSLLLSEEISVLRSENERLRGALEWVATMEPYDLLNAVEARQRAREALDD